MTATEELRRLLDERGVEWSDSPNENVLHTVWNGLDCWFIEYPDGSTGWGMSMCGTPEQAVTATLGKGTCHDSNTRFDAWKCSECGATMLLMFDDCDEPTYSVDGIADVPHYCHGCGRKVVANGQA